MHKKWMTIIALLVLLASTLFGCSGVPSDSSTLTILSITEGNVFVMKAGADDWTEATLEMTLEVGDTIKTGDDSGAEITFFDGSTIELEAGTQIEITSLDTSPDTGTKTITLMQTIGTTVSRVTALLDPASTYAVETPSGVAAVRGSIMIVRIVFDDPNYEDGTVLIASVEGHIYWIGNGEELQLPEGAQVIATNETAQLVQLSLALDDSVATDEDTPAIVAAPGVLGNDSGLIVGDTLAVTAVDTSGTVGNVTTWDADGSFTYDPNGQFEGLEASNSTTDSFTYTVTDDFGITDTATVTITINGVYDAPPYTPPPSTPPPYYPPPYYPPVNHLPVALDDTATTDEDNSISVDAPGVLENDSDPDAGDTLAVAAVDTNETIGALTSWSANGAFTYDPSGQFEDLEAGNSTTDSFTYTLSDGHGGTDVATVTITINGVYDTPENNRPMAVDDTATTDEDNPVAAAAPGVLINDSDPDVGDTLTVTSVDTSGTLGAVTFNPNGSYTYDPNGQFEGLSDGNSTTDSLTYTVSDGNGGTDTATVTVTVNGVNDVPVAVDDTATTNEDNPVAVAAPGVLVNDSDPDVGDTLTVTTVNTIGTVGAVTWSADGSFTYNPNGQFEDLSDGSSTTDSFTYTVSDGHGGTDTATVTITINGVNDPGEMTATISVTVDQGPTAPIYITTDGGWAIDEDTGEPVDGTNHETSGPTHSITVAGGHSYCVYVRGDVTRYVDSPPPGWSGEGTETACGIAEAGGHYALHFTQN